MNLPDKSLLEAPLTPHEMRWGSELADNLPGDEDLTFDEIKTLARVPIDEWPAELLLKVKDVISFDDFMNGRDEEK